MEILVQFTTPTKARPPLVEWINSSIFRFFPEKKIHVWGEAGNPNDGNNFINILVFHRKLDDVFLVVPLQKRSKSGWFGKNSSPWTDSGN